MWRCKWIELQIKELQSQALKYDRELAVYDQRKQNFTIEGFDAKSLPFSRQLRNKVMTRKKRKRVEETVDVTSYMSQHNLFSYYGMKFTSFDVCCNILPHTSIIHVSFLNISLVCFSPEKKRSIADGAPIEGYCGNLGKKY